MNLILYFHFLCFIKEVFHPSTMVCLSHREAHLWEIIRLTEGPNPRGNCVLTRKTWLVKVEVLLSSPDHPLGNDSLSCVLSHLLGFVALISLLLGGDSGPCDTSNANDGKILEYFPFWRLMSHQRIILSQKHSVLVTKSYCGRERGRGINLHTRKNPA